MELSDDTIIIRPFKREDAVQHLEGEDNEQIKWLSGGKSTLEGVQNWINKNRISWDSDEGVYNFAIVDKESSKLVGMIEANTHYKDLEGLYEGDANISYGLYPVSRGKGYASRAVNLICNFLKSKGLKKAIIRVNPENTNSLKLPLKCGFTESEIILSKNNESLQIFIKNLS